jgi:hypothetical protein
MCLGRQVNRGLQNIKNDFVQLPNILLYLFLFSIR